MPRNLQKQNGVKSNSGKGLRRAGYDDIILSVNSLNDIARRDRPSANGGDAYKLAARLFA